MRISDWSSDVCSSDLIAIIDHGGGWVSLLTGMIALSVGVGDTVDAGAPVGRAGSDDSRITVELRRGGRPVDVAAMIGYSHVPSPSRIGMPRMTRPDLHRIMVCRG